jgi:hypothetical protein
MAPRDPAPARHALLADEPTAAEAAHDHGVLKDDLSARLTDGTAPSACRTGRTGGDETLPGAIAAVTVREILEQTLHSRS